MPFHEFPSRILLLFTLKGIGLKLKIYFLFYLKQQTKIDQRTLLIHALNNRAIDENCLEIFELGTRSTEIFNKAVGLLLR